MSHLNNSEAQMLQRCGTGKGRSQHSTHGAYSYTSKIPLAYDASQWSSRYYTPFSGEEYFQSWRPRSFCLNTHQYGCWSNYGGNTSMTRLFHSQDSICPFTLNWNSCPPCCRTGTTWPLEFSITNDKQLWPRASQRVCVSWILDASHSYSQYVFLWLLLFPYMLDLSKVCPDREARKVAFRNHKHPDSQAHCICTHPAICHQRAPCKDHVI
jgi:hypothetical protein